MNIKENILLLLIIILLGFLLGWLFPVEGPVDYVYDNYKAQRCAPKSCPPRQVQKPELEPEEELISLYEILTKEQVENEQ